jgi:hypothetical protein
MAWRRRGVLAVAVMVVTLLGCGDDGGGADAEAATSTTAAVEVSTTSMSTTAPETTTSTVPAIEPPDNTGTDMVAILQSLSDFGNRLGMAPDPDLVDLAYVPGLEAHARLTEILNILQQKGLRWNGPVERLEDIRDNGRLTERTWSLTAISRPILEARVIDASGAVIEEQPARPQAKRLVYELLRGDDGRWRIATIQALAPA